MIMAVISLDSQLLANKVQRIKIKAFLSTPSNRWKPADFSLSDGKPEPMASDICHIVKTTSLLESRADQYSNYLRSVLKSRDREWIEAINQWNSEERQHGEVLRLLSESVSCDYHFESLMSAYVRDIPYHSLNGRSVRGAVAAELVTRCVVEALASTFYKVLADATKSKTHQKVFITLSRDEARHFGMFLKMLAAEENQQGKMPLLKKIKVMVSRILELEDSQIMGASAITAGRSFEEKNLSSEANFYISCLYRYYYWRHMVYVTRLLFRTAGIDRQRYLVIFVATILFIGLKLRWFKAMVFKRKSDQSSLC